MNLRTYQSKMLAISISLVSLILFILPAQINPDNFMHDDSYFYLQVAYNIVNGFGSTFSQITPTNGYHPLWMLFSVIGLVLSRGDKAVTLHVISGIQALMFLGTAFFFFKIAQLISLRLWIVGLPLIATYFLSTAVFGSEAHLNAFMLTTGLYFLLLACASDKAKHWIWAGVFLGLSFLARLDNVFIVASGVCFGLLGQPVRDIRKLFKRLILLSVPFFLTVTPYLLLNVFSYGHLVPISGSIKSSFPTVTADIHNLGTLGKIVTVFGIYSLILSFGHKSDRLRVRLLRILGSGVLLHAGYVVLFTDHYTFWSWYYVAGVLNIGFAVPITLDLILSRFEKSLSLRAINQFVGLLVSLFLIFGIARAWLKAYNPDSIGPIRLPARINEDRWPIEVASWMRQNLQAQTGVFVHDWPGAMAYYSDLRILPADGLMNDYDYNDDIIALGINQYLCKNDVDFYFGPILSDEADVQHIEILSPLQRQAAGSIRILDSNLIVRVKDIVKSPQGAPSYAIWRIDNAGICD